MTTALMEPTATTEKSAVVRKAVIRFVLGMFVPAAILFMAAGRMDWAWAWIYVGVLAICVSLNLFVLIPHNPEVVEERMSHEKGLRTWDKVIASCTSVFWFAALLAAGLDQRFQWSPRMALWLQIAALFMLVLGDLLFLWAMAVNKFFSKFVRIQKERGHQVVTTGPYQYIRHPGYIGWSMMNMAPPLILGSWWALIPAALAVCGMIVRTALEDRTLQNELAGYKAYAQRVRYRLVPGVW